MHQHAPVWLRQVWVVHDIWQRHLDKQFLISVSGDAKKSKVKKKSDKQFFIRVGVSGDTKIFESEKELGEKAVEKHRPTIEDCTLPPSPPDQEIGSQNEELVE